MTTKKLYKIVELEESGFMVKSIIAVIESESKKKARELAAIKLQNPEIVTTGFYQAVRLSKKQWLKDIKTVYDKLIILKNVIT